MPSRRDKDTIIQKTLVEDSKLNRKVKVTSEIKIMRLIKCWAKKVVGEGEFKDIDFNKLLALEIPPPYKKKLSTNNKNTKQTKPELDSHTFEEIDKTYSIFPKF